MANTEDRNPSMSQIQSGRNMNYAILAATGGVIGTVCLTRHVLTLVALKLGAGNMFLGVLSFATYVPMACMLFAIPWVGRFGKRRILMQANSAAMLVAMPFLLLPILVDHWPMWACLGLVLIVTLLRSMADGFGFAAWWPLLKDIVPNEITGRFFARMQMVVQGATLLITIGAFCLLGSRPDWWKFEIIFSVAIAAFLMRVIVLIPIVEKPVLSDAGGRVGIYSTLRDCCSEKPFRLMMIYIIAYIIPAFIAEPFQVKMLNDFGCSYGFILAATCMIAVGAVFSLMFWGKLADKFGNRSIFSVSHVGMAVTTLMWLAVGKSTFSSILVFGLFFSWGVFHHGNFVAQRRYMMHIVPSEKQIYISIINLCVWLAVAVAPLLGGLFLHLTEKHSFSVGQTNLTNYQILFIISAVLFVVPHILRKRLKLKEDMPTLQVIAFVARPLRGVLGPFVGVGKTTTNDKDSGFPTSSQ